MDMSQREKLRTFWNVAHIPEDELENGTASIVTLSRRSGNHQAVAIIDNEGFLCSPGHMEYFQRELWDLKQ